jgi:hypothetical protein
MPHIDMLVKLYQCEGDQRGRLFYACKSVTVYPNFALPSEGLF